MADLAGFESRLDDHPEDWACRTVYADALDEAGNAELAAAQRWMAANRKHSRAARLIADPGEYGTSFEWWNFDRPDNAFSPDDPSELPGDVFAGLRGELPPHVIGIDRVKGYPTRAAAESALAHALSAREESARV